MNDVRRSLFVCEALPKLPLRGAAAGSATSPPRPQQQQRQQQQQQQPPRGGPGTAGSSSSSARAVLKEATNTAVLRACYVPSVEKARGGAKGGQAATKPRSARPRAPSSNHAGEAHLPPAAARPSSAGDKAPRRPHRRVVAYASPDKAHLSFDKKPSPSSARRERRRHRAEAKLNVAVCSPEQQQQQPPRAAARRLGPPQNEKGSKNSKDHPAARSNSAWNSGSKPRLKKASSVSFASPMEEQRRQSPPNRKDRRVALRSSQSAATMVTPSPETASPEGPLMTPRSSHLGATTPTTTPRSRGENTNHVVPKTPKTPEGGRAQQETALVVESPGAFLTPGLTPGSADHHHHGGGFDSDAFHPRQIFQQDPLLAGVSSSTSFEEEEEDVNFEALETPPAAMGRCCSQKKLEAYLTSPTTEATDDPSSSDSEDDDVSFHVELDKVQKNSSVDETPPLRRLGKISPENENAPEGAGDNDDDAIDCPREDRDSVPMRDAEEEEEEDDDGLVWEPRATFNKTHVFNEHRLALEDDDPFDGDDGGGDDPEWAWRSDFKLDEDAFASNAAPRRTSKKTGGFKFADKNKNKDDDDDDDDDADLRDFALFLASSATDLPPLGDAQEPSLTVPSSRSLLGPLPPKLAAFSTLCTPSAPPLAPLPEERPLLLDALGVPLMVASAVDAGTARLRDGDDATKRGPTRPGFRRRSSFRRF